LGFQGVQVIAFEGGNATAARDAGFFGQAHVSIIALWPTERSPVSHLHLLAG
jgi:hypothetical protein